MAMDMRSMVGALAQMPPDQRKTMMRMRLEQFAEMNDLERTAAMRQMMEAVGALPRDNAKKLLATRTEILFELPESSRMTLMKTHMGLLSQMPPERAKMEMELVGEIAPQLSPAAQRGVQEMMKMMPMPAMGGPAAMSAVRAAMADMTQDERVDIMAEVMGGVAELPDDQRALMVRKMTALLS